MSSTTNRPLTYLASPYSHPDRAVRVQRFEAACRAAAALMRGGVHLYSPIAHTHPIAEAGDLPKGWDFWKQYDSAILSCCHTLIVLRIDGWQESKGIQAELQIAAELGITIEYIDPDPAEQFPMAGAPTRDDLIARLSQEIAWLDAPEVRPKVQEKLTGLRTLLDDCLTHFITPGI